MVSGTASILSPAAAPERPWLAYGVGALLGVGCGLLIAAHSYKPLLALVGATIAVVIFWRPYLGLLLVVATIPVDVSGLFGDSRSMIVPSVTKYLGALTVLAAVADVLIRQRRPALRRLLTPQTGAALILVLIAGVSGALHASADSGREIMRLATVVLFVLTAVYFVDRPERAAQVLVVIALAATAAALHSVLQSASRAVRTSEEWVGAAGAVLDVSEAEVGQFLRTTGAFSHPAWLGLFLSVAIPCTLFIVWTTRRPAVAALGLGAVVVEVLGIFYTYSRMAYVGAALALGLFALRRRLGPVTLVALMLAGLAAVPMLPREVRARVRSILLYRESSSSLTRIGQQLAGWSMFQQNFVCGVGPGNFAANALDYGRQVAEPFNVEPIGAHNMYVEVAAELGAPGLVVLLFLLGASWRDARRLRRKATAAGDRRVALLWECVGVALLVFMVSAFFVHAEYRKEWWLLIALVAAGRTFPEASPAAEEQVAAS